MDELELLDSAVSKLDSASSAATNIELSAFSPSQDRPTTPQALPHDRLKNLPEYQSLLDQIRPHIRLIPPASFEPCADSGCISELLEAVDPQTLNPEHIAEMGLEKSLSILMVYSTVVLAVKHHYVVLFTMVDNGLVELLMTIVCALLRWAGQDEGDKSMEQDFRSLISEFGEIIRQ